MKVVILHHNKPENADKLYEQLSECFDVEIWDSGSDPDKIPVNMKHSFVNIYWTGGWNEIMDRYKEEDAVWMIGCDIELLQKPEEYLEAITSAMPFGCWSPCIEGRAHPFMLAENYKDNEPKSVRNVEGMAMACSGELMREVGKLLEGSEIGFGLDYWLCYRAREMGLRNIIDGRVKIFHPEGIGYDEQKAHDQMEETFTKHFGEHFRRTIFQYDERYELNLVPKVGTGCGFFPEDERDKFTIVTVENGWGIEEFNEITDKFPEAERIIMQMGISTLGHLADENTTVIESVDMAMLISRADVALFTRTGPANEKEYKQLLKAGVPMVVHVDHHQDMIDHEKNGFVYGSTNWAVDWIKHLEDKEARDTISASWREKPQVAEESEEPVFTVITPTWKRDLKIISRCVDCLKLQTVTDWRQLICSNGAEEPKVRKFVEDLNDPRVEYHWCEAQQGDHGNYARREMLKKVTGRFVMFFDDDNIIMPEYMKRMWEEMSDPNVDFAVCRIMHFGPLNEEVIGKPPIVLEGDPVKLYHIDPLQVVVLRKVMQDIGWDVDHGYVSDGVTLEKLSQYTSATVEEVLAVHT